MYVYVMDKRVIGVCLCACFLYNLVFATQCIDFDAPVIAASIVAASFCDACIFTYVMYAATTDTTAAFGCVYIFAWLWYGSIHWLYVWTTIILAFNCLLNNSLLGHKMKSEQDVLATGKSADAHFIHDGSMIVLYDDM